MMVGFNKIINTNIPHSGINVESTAAHQAITFCYRKELNDFGGLTKNRVL